MGFGSPEFLLVFRKPQTDKGKAYADEPVTHDREAYGLGQWQIDADAIWRSSGNRLLDIPTLVRMANSERGLSAVKKPMPNGLTNTDTTTANTSNSQKPCTPTADCPRFSASCRLQ